LICEDTQSLLDGYLDHELDLMRSVDIERHLKECEKCSVRYENLQSLRAGVSRDSLYYFAPAGLQQRVLLTLSKEMRTESRLPVLVWRWFGAAAALIIVCVVIWSVIGFIRKPSAEELLAQEAVSSHVRSLMVDHLTDVLSSDQHTVKPWFNGKLDFAPPVDDLSSQGFPLIGGRLDYLDSRQVAALVYQRRQHFINLFVWPVAGNSNFPQKVLTRQGYNVVHWTTRGMNYWAVSDISESELQEFVRVLQSR
jgi:anti-sigma factor RsiW